MHSIAAGKIIEIGEFSLTNTMLAGILTALVMIITAVILRIQLNERPGKLQAFLEILYDFIHDLTVRISDENRAKKFFPWIFGFFLFILLSNYMGLLPFYGESIKSTSEDKNFQSEDADLKAKIVPVAFAQESVVIDSDLLNINTVDNQNEKTKESVSAHENTEESNANPLLRASTSDFNYTFALAAISFILVIGFGIFMQKPPFLGFFIHYFQPGELKKMRGIMKFAMLPLFAFVACLEMLLEPLKAISLSFRLFGNVYAGETLIVAMTTIAGGNPTLFIATPFYLLEFLVAFIQAFVFSLLTLVFISLATQHH